MKYPCLVLDHDDTIVNSTATVHFPSFQAFVKKYRPQAHEYTLEEYFLKNFHPGTLALFRDELGLNDQEMEAEQAFWNDYVQQYVPSAYAGIAELLWAHQKQGGKICVVSHSLSHNILRDYAENHLPQPDLVFGWDTPEAQRKPSAYPLQTIMKTFSFAPEQLLVVDDSKPGFDMAQSCGVPFAAAGWAYDISQIETFMRQNCERYFKTVAEFAKFLQE